MFANQNALLLLVGGALLSVLLGLLVYVLATGRMRALSLVGEKTRELSEKNRELSHQATHDALTGLPNRALVLDHAKQMLARTARQPGMVAGALFIDFDGFKHVNDKLGHAAGDKFLTVVAERLRRTVREQDTVGRLAGDEFVVLVDSPGGEAALDVLADRITRSLREPVELNEGREVLSVTASIGIAVGQYAAPDDLLRDADLALYAAKAAGKDRYVLFEPSMALGVESRGELDSDLSRALAAEQLFLLYQPIIDLPSRELVGVEALIRWRHPTRGVLPPDSFIPLAEASGLIVPIGRWVLGEACRQAAAWAAEGHLIGMFVNVSAYQLAGRGFADDVREALVGARIEPSSLTLEITEKRSCATSPLLASTYGSSGRSECTSRSTTSAQVTRRSQTSRACPSTPLRSTAVSSRRCITGTVAASCSRPSSPWARPSPAVVAEGIEEYDQLTTLQEMGCQTAQGFLMGEPSPAEDIALLLAGRKSQHPVRRPTA